MRKAEKLHLYSAGQDEIAAGVEAMIELLGGPIADFGRKIAGLIAEDQTLAAQARLLAAVPGVGPTVLATLLGELPELGTLCRRRIASLPDSLPTPEKAEPGAALGASGAAAEKSGKRFIPSP